MGKDRSRGISNTWLKKGIEEPRCPMCHNLLYVSGDTTNYMTRVQKDILSCTNPECDYKRTKLSKLDSSKND